MASKNHFQGKKGGKHTTVIDAAEKVVRIIKDFPEVKKICPGLIRFGQGNGGKSFKVVRMSGGLLLKIRGVKSVQEIRVYSNDIDRVLEKIDKTFSK